MKRIGIVGCGNISGIYFENIMNKFSNITVSACCDLDESRAKAAAEKYHVPEILTTDELLHSDKVDIVLNLTTPPYHYQICMDALNAGKHVYTEKPLSLNKDEGAALVKTAQQKGLYIGCAPDTFMGGGIQTCRKLIDDGWIGEPVAATAFMTCHGHESWHPDPAFYYKVGGGPMFDMGPYYITALVNLMGPVASVSGEARITFPQRTITSQPKYGTQIDVEVATHVAGTMRFENGAIATVITSFDVWAANLPFIEIYGTAGSLSVPDPNMFGGSVKVRKSFHEAWHEIPLTHPYSENSRGYGLSDMARAIEEGSACRASGQLANHVLEVMHAFIASSDSGRRITIASTVEKPAAL